MPWYPADDSYPSMPRPTVNTRPFISTAATSSTMGRMPMTVAYSAPMEAEVVSRADFLHVMLRAAFGANYLAPLTNPEYILDVCCGSGRWVREMAGEFPAARIVGLDITSPAENNPATSGVFAPSAHQARTYAFVQHNVLEPLTFAPSSFDLTHMRQVMSVLPVAAWPQVVGEMARVTKYGGWVELTEGGMLRDGGPALDTIQRWTLQAMLPHGLDPRLSAQLPDLLYTLSLSDIRAHTIELPIGPHGGHFGELMGNDFLARVEGLRARIIGARVASPEQFTQAQIALRQEMERMEYVQPFYIACGRR